MRILVTGANGLLGQKLVSLLLENKEFEVVATGRGVNRNPASGYSYFARDLKDESSVISLLDKVSPDAVIHAAAMTQVDDCEKDRTACWNNNVDATRHIVKACQKTDSFLLYVSTDFVFDGEDGPYDESSFTNPINYYGESKLASEELVKQNNLKWAIARTVLVYGISANMSRSNIVLWVKESLEQNKPIRVVNDQWRTPTLVEDLAGGCIKIVSQSAEGIYHLSGGETFTPYTLALRVAAYFELDKNLITPVNRSTFTQLGERPIRTGFDISKAKRLLQFSPRKLEDGLKLISNQLDQMKSGHIL